MYSLVTAVTLDLTLQYQADMIMIMKHSPVRSLRSYWKNANILENGLEEPKCTGERFGAKSYSVTGPCFWDKLPVELRETNSLDTKHQHLC